MHVAKIEITRDDLSLKVCTHVNLKAWKWSKTYKCIIKAKAVLKDKLTAMWKQSCRRRKLREVLSDEMSWRAHVCQMCICDSTDIYASSLVQLVPSCCQFSVVVRQSREASNRLINAWSQHLTFHAETRHGHDYNQWSDPCSRLEDYA